MMFSCNRMPLSSRLRLLLHDYVFESEIMESALRSRTIGVDEYYQG